MSTDKCANVPMTEVSGNLQGWTVDEMEAIRSLYFLVYPWARDEEFERDFVNPPPGTEWRVARDANGRIHLAVLMGAFGNVFPFLRPEESDSPEILHAFLSVMPEISAIFVQRGFSHGMFIVARTLQRFGQALERAGYVGPPNFEFRSIHFGPRVIEKAQ